jgi:hypothetical protein
MTAKIVCPHCKAIDTMYISATAIIPLTVDGRPQGFDGPTAVLDWDYAELDTRSEHYKYSCSVCGKDSTDCSIEDFMVDIAPNL